MRFPFRFGLITLACILICSCKNEMETPMELADIISDLSVTSAPETDYEKPAIITGHISNRDFYPDEKEVLLTIPTLSNVPISITSPIWSDGSFSFEFFPYAMRQVSLSPYMEELIIGPGDSIHVEIDFKDLMHVSCSGNGADNNEKLTIFHNKYYLRNWPWFNHDIEENSGYEAAEQFIETYNELRDEYRASLENFIRNEKPSKELEEFCRKEIETDYTRFVLFMPFCQKRTGKDVSKLFDMKEIESLFEQSCMNGNIYFLASGFDNWLEFLFCDGKEYDHPEEFVPGYLKYLDKNTGNGMFRQMMVSYLFNIMIDDNLTELFEQSYGFFSKTVTDPVLKLSTRDRYLSRKSFKDDPSMLTNAILYPDKRGDAPQASTKINDGVQFLRDRVEQNERKVIYINIGAHWCRGCVEERPYQWKLAEMFKDEPLKIVNIIIGANQYADRDSVSTFGTMIEDYLLTDEQYYGIDHILKLGNNGIPYYILINKDGLIVDYGDHLRPSFAKTAETLKVLLAE